MGKMQRAILRLIAAAMLTMWGLVLYLAIDLAQRESLATLPILPTLATLPTLTPSPTIAPAVDPTPVVPPSSQTLPLARQGEGLPGIGLSSPTPTLTARLLNIVAVMPGVYLPPTAAAYPPLLTVIPAIPNPYEPLAEATRTAPPYYGWYSFESDHPLVQYATPWERRLHALASRGQYHRTEDVSSSVSFVFEGEGLCIRYVAARNMGMFQVVVDGIIIDTVDAYAPEIAFPGTRVYTLTPGQHTLVLRSAGTKHAQSEGYTVALDAIQVWRGDPHTLVQPPAPPAAPTAASVPARVELLVAPPSPEPTATPGAPQPQVVALVIGYDENGNRAVDPAEGVSGIPMRVVEAESNRLLASGITDAAGYAEVAYESAGAARLVVPYFGRVWTIPRSRDGMASFELVLQAGNQPGVVP
ncbi:MAG: hypothetical protein SF123_15640 [Chloroflexota bacterium]|nr:hypothetical protein [Chloroflexota bacterium]